MLNRYPLWKYLLLLAIVVFSLIYAAPNFYGEDPALQISGARNVEINEADRERVERLFSQHNLQAKSIEFHQTSILVRLNDLDTQLAAQELLRKELGDRYIVALNLAPATPKWLTALGAEPMRLGLDLRGGVYFLLQVDMEQAFNRREESFINDIRNELRTDRLRVTNIERQRQGGLTVSFRDAETRDAAFSVLRGAFPDLEITRDQRANTPVLIARLNETALANMREYTMSQTITTLRNRVNELGVAEASVAAQGIDRVVVQLPGVQDTARAKEILGGTATLEFLMHDNENPSLALLEGAVPPAGSKIYHLRDGSPTLLKTRVILTGESIVDATTGFDESGLPEVNIRVSGPGTRLFARVTRENIGNQMAVVYVETVTTTKVVDGKEVRHRETFEEVISLATIQSALGNNFRITGLGSSAEAQNLALLLRAGALPTGIEIVEERTVGPSLGKENIETGVFAIKLALGLTLLVMFLYYSMFGMIANAALLMNLALLVAVLSLVPGATLTLPGIAGIVLTVGMAVDANVLIFERIREELRNGSSPQASIHAGYERAFATIVDANLTTLIVAFILFALGTGAVKGFAVVLSIGILTSMFTAIFGTRALVNLMYGGRTIKKLPVGI